MRPLHHPGCDEVTVQGILYALSDPVRLRIYAQLRKASCSQNCSAFLNLEDTPLPKSTLSQHLKVLRDSGLIRSERKGVELRSHARWEELHGRFGPLLTAIVETYAGECGGWKKARRQRA